MPPTPHFGAEKGPKKGVLTEVEVLSYAERDSSRVPLSMNYDFIQLPEGIGFTENGGIYTSRKSPYPSVASIGGGGGNAPSEGPLPA